MMKLGILGAGQLARMLSLSAHSLGIETYCYSAQPECASQVTHWVSGDFSPASLHAFASTVDVITLENENIDADVIRLLSDKVTVYPSVDALIASQDRLYEKNLFTQLDIPTPTFAAIDDLSSLTKWVELHGLPLVIKTRRFGYDGRGQVVVRQPSDLVTAWESFSTVPLIVEAFVPFDYEVSLIAARNPSGMVRFYPLARNHHSNGILRTSTPYEHPMLNEQAQRYMLQLMQALNYVGVLAVEFFVQNDQLLANEMAPRVHNTGHWTMDGAVTSQFDQHLRAVFDLPLGETIACTAVTMFNCIGTLPTLPAVLAVPGACYHAYGKSAKPGRKLGHINVLRADESYQMHCQHIAQLTWPQGNLE
jgi:5-(carboxyamino)imidazole ribonucleotide synthase